MEKQIKEMLYNTALEARKKAYAPYSEFAVGAALLTDSDKIYTGCNVENASYGLTNCAERTAIFKAISAGEHNFKAMAVIADSEEPVTPCGACLQVINEFTTNMKILMYNLQGKKLEIDSNQLLPHAFHKGDINGV